MRFEDDPHAEMGLPRESALRLVGRGCTDRCERRAARVCDKQWRMANGEVDGRKQLDFAGMTDAQARNAKPCYGVSFDLADEACMGECVFCEIVVSPTWPPFTHWKWRSRTGLDKGRAVRHWRVTLHGGCVGGKTWS